MRGKRNYAAFKIVGDFSILTMPDDDITGWGENNVGWRTVVFHNRTYVEDLFRAHNSIDEAEGYHDSVVEIITENPEKYKP
jgi:hypothetical protein